MAMGYARVGKMAMGGSTLKLDFTPRDVGMVLADIALTMATKDTLIKQGIIPANILSSIAVLVGGALVNTLAFSRSNYLFTMLKSSGADEERKLHYKAIEQLQAAHEA